MWLLLLHILFGAEVRDHYSYWLRFPSGCCLSSLSSDVSSESTAPEEAGFVEMAAPGGLVSALPRVALVGFSYTLSGPGQIIGAREGSDERKQPPWHSGVRAAVG